MIRRPIIPRARNARIMGLLEARGFRGVKPFALHFEIFPTALLSRVVAGALPAKTKAGAWRQVVLDLADALGVKPEELFPEPPA